MELPAFCAACYSSQMWALLAGLAHWPAGLVQPASGFCIAGKLRMVFMSVNLRLKKKIKRVFHDM